MFVGHYGVSFALKRLEPRLSLGILFLAVQGLDVLFSGFVLAGLEKMRIVPGFTAYNPYDLYFMPYSHSLAGAVGWSLLAFGAFLALRRKRLAAAALVAAAVFSHFVLDVPVHTPDLPLLGAGSAKLGLGLWNRRWAALGLELACLGAGLLLYLRATRAASAGARRVTGAVVGILLLAAVSTPFLPPPSSGTAFAVQALAGYGLLAALGEWLDRSRTGTPAPEPQRPGRLAASAP